MERNWSREAEHREVVQLGAIRVSGARLVEEDAFTILVKPHFNPVLSDYFTGLTGITQQSIEEQGIDYMKAVRMLAEWINKDDTYSFGGDEKILLENCRMLDMQFPLRNKFFDVRDIFERYGIAASNYTSSSIVEAFGRKVARRAHDALNDVRTTLDGLRLLVAELQSEGMASIRHCR